MTQTHGVMLEALTAGNDFTTPANTTIKIDTNMLHFLGYDNQLFLIILF